MFLAALEDSRCPGATAFPRTSFSRILDVDITAHTPEVSSQLVRSMLAEAPGLKQSPSYQKAIMTLDTFYKTYSEHQPRPADSEFPFTALVLHTYVQIWSTYSGQLVSSSLAVKPPSLGPPLLPLPRCNLRQTDRACAWVWVCQGADLLPYWFSTMIL